VGSRIGLDEVMKRIYSPCQDSNPGHLASSLIAVLTGLSLLLLLYMKVKSNFIFFSKIVYCTKEVHNIKWNPHQNLELLFKIFFSMLYI
jgi:hypothetical protein